MIPEVPSVKYYSKQPVELQVKLQIALVRHYSEDWMDMPSFSMAAFRAHIEADMERDLEKHIKDEKYELCSIYKDAIDNLEYISIRHIF